MKIKAFRPDGTQLCVYSEGDLKLATGFTVSELRAKGWTIETPKKPPAPKKAKGDNKDD